MFNNVPPHVVSRLKQRHLQGVWQGVSHRQWYNCIPSATSRRLTKRSKDGGYVFWLASDGQAQIEWKQSHLASCEPVPISLGLEEPKRELEGRREPALLLRQEANLRLHTLAMHPSNAHKGERTD